MDVKIFAAFVFGLAAGALGTYLYLDPKYQKQNAENLEMNRRHYEELKAKLEEEKKLLNPLDIQPEDKVIVEKGDKELFKNPAEKARDLATKLNYNALYNKEPLTPSSEDKTEDQIYLITPMQYDSETLYEKRVLTYYEGDDTLCDELTDEILDIENFIGVENVKSFGNQTEDDPYIMHIRNNKFGCVYEVVKDERSYSAVMENQ